ncbi:PREDICTED: dehydrodolichyl diphosphate synthase 6-like [Ipomoea nil]|uniref:dehydrodolichyl diphosphate synthase 6-like n=1 Tax=Ipomoea nil TaxID=35883 RepID=UPI000901A6F2|nr:PREDICTED: dehydrodolichyl diphosphate synthase 6-like [Ipomoea nil]
MDEDSRQRVVGWLFGSLLRHLRSLLFRVLSVGVIPKHIAFILDGNRRYSRKMKIPETVGYRAAFLALVCVICYCYELGVKYVTIYAFSIDNFKRRPDEIEFLMDLMLTKLEALLKYQNALDEYGVRIHFVGNLHLLDSRIQAAAGKVMEATKKNSNFTLLVCLVYTSTNEIVHAAEECCKEKKKLMNGTAAGGAAAAAAEERVITVVDLEKHMFMGLAPEVDILVRTSGETRLSNFLLWQTSSCLLYSPGALFPEIGLRHLVWAVLKFQRAHPYLQKRRIMVS